MLIDQSEFVGLDDVVHLCAGGEAPMLRSHLDVMQRFMAEKAQGERARQLQADVVKSTRDQCAQLFGVPASDLTFLSSASEGINIVSYGLDWHAGDNVVIADVEFASGVYPWTRLQALGVEIRVVKHQNWQITMSALEEKIDQRTRVVLMSQVSMFTGQRIQVKPLADLVHSYDAALVLDATHAAGVVPVDAQYADVMVSSCYKWLLGVHGTAVFYWNRKTFPTLSVPFLGWNSASVAGGWEDPLQFSLHADAHRFMPANPSFLSLYLLNNALSRLLPLSKEAIESHALALTEKLWLGAEAMGWDMMTPGDAEARAGNVCIMTDRVNEVAKALQARRILIWGTYAGDARLRISAHVYNSDDDIDACLDGLSQVV